MITLIRRVRFNKTGFLTLVLILGFVISPSVFARKDPPTVAAQAATSIGTDSATLHGTITANGTATNNNTFFKYGTTSNPVGGVYDTESSTVSTIATGSFQLAVTGLSPSTTYYFVACATANESGGKTGCSGELSFTTDPAALTAPTVTVQPATVVGTRDATLNGTVTVNGSATNNDTYFEYGVSIGPPYDTTSATVSTIATGSFTLPVTGLEPDTLYYFRACATANETGGLTGCSSEITFNTDPQTAPTVNVQAATLIQTDGATLHGTITANGSAADNDTYFKYGTSSGVYTVTTGSAGTVTTGAFQFAVTGLDPSTTYYYIACATANEADGLEGCSSGEQSFTTNADLTAPTVTVQPATGIGTSGATLNGNVTVNGSATNNNTFFKYGNSSGVYTVTTGSAGTVTTGAFSLAVTGLDPNTTYYYIACATANEPGGLEGCSSAEQSFTTEKLAPTVTVQTATSIGSRTATLNGTVTVNGSAADNNTFFKYGTSSGVYTITTGSAGTVTTGVFSLAVSGLDPSTTYYYIACATANETGRLEGCSSGEEIFTTDPLTAPTVTAQAATAITSDSATLNGIVTVNGSATDNNTYFKYGTSSGVYTVTTPVASTVTTGAFSYDLTSLDPETTYYFIACATANESGGLEGCSGELSFSTTVQLTAPTVTAQAATAIGTDSATLHGTITVNGSATDNDTYFKYGTSSGIYTVTTPSAGTVTTGSFSYGVTSLNPNTTYYFIACATGNETGGLEGCSGELSFTTDKLAPTVSVQAATAIGSRTATLNGTVTVNGSATDNNTFFKYGTSSGVYTITTGSAGTVTTGAFSLAVSGLDPSTTYYYIACATANEADGLEGCSGETSFSTNPLTAPTVTVQAATAIGTNGATLRGTITVNGSATDNDTYFKYGINSGGPYDTTTTSAGTVTTGSFSKVVTGLETDTTYYYIACAFANETDGMEGCSSGEESFTTVASVSQATNLWFHNIGSTAMTLFWTEGIGDGSIVVMKQGGAVDANPANGIEHLASSTFGSGEELGTGNFVVYRGTGEAVHVTGLTQGQTYHVAIFTYTGAGLSIEYLLPGPAIGNETTTANTPHNVAVLNIDESVGCTSGCHGFHGSAVIPRGDAQETMCRTCHNPSGLANALENNFSLHTNDTGFPAEIPGVIAAGTVDCGSCHELHNPSGDDTTYTQHPITNLWANNLSYLRANPQKYVSSALPWPENNLVVHDSTEWAFEDGAAYEGACQICHTNTTAYNNTPSAGDTHQGGDLGDVDCKGCHDHGGNFAGGGGDCTECHNSIQDKDGAGGNPGRRIVTTELAGGGDPDLASTHLTPTVDAADCEVCHDQSSHQAGQVKLFDPDGGTSISIASYTDPRTDSTEAAKLTAFCEACHDSNGANGDTTPFTTNATAVDVSTDWTNSSHNASSSVGCFGDGEFGCHASGHGSRKLTLLAPHDVTPTPPANTEEQEGFCFNCHDGSPATRDIENEFTMVREITPTDYRAQRTAFNPKPGALVNQRHDVLYADQQYSGGVIECNSCHTPHKDNSSTPEPYAPVSNPDDGSPLSFYSPTGSYITSGPPAYNFTYNTGSNEDPVNPRGCNPTYGTPATGCETVPGRTEPDYVEFCLTCHDGNAPGDPDIVTMDSRMIDMAGAYINDQHGRITGGGSSKGYMKPPWAPGSGGEPALSYAALNCTTCHGAHGSKNIYNLRSEINVAGVQMEVGGWTGDTIGGTTASGGTVARSGETSYVLPEIGGTQTDHYWGAWCSFCHQMQSHGESETGSCRGTHMHGAGAF